MYEFECLTNNQKTPRLDAESCRPFSGACYPEVEGCCGPDCSPM